MHIRQRMHTAEHLLTAVMRIYYHAPRNEELHLGNKKTKCDYSPQKPLNDNDITVIERLVNKEIQKDHAVSAFTIQRGEAGDYDLWKVPEDAEDICIYQIGELDAQPCAGPHVSHTKQVGAFKIISHEFKDDGKIRIRFRVEEK
ncbi:MAG: hypothetical protein ACE5I1_24055 [bacterium]